MSIVVTLFFMLPAYLYSYPEGWSDDILLTPGDYELRFNPDIDVDSCNNVWAVWDTATWVNGTAEILYSKRDSLGNCLIPETPVSNNPSYSVLSRIVVDGSNNVHFVWRDETPQGMGLWHARLADDGSVLVPSHLAVSGAGGLAIYHDIALDKYQNINVAWEESPSGYDQVSYTKLDSLGNPIIAEIRVSPQGLYAYWPGIGVDSFGNIHVAYRTDTSGTPYRLTYSKLDKEGNILISNKILGFGGLPTIIADRNQNIHMVYGEYTGTANKIEYLKLDQNGNFLIYPKTISTPEISSNTYSHMAMDSLQYLNVVWQGDSQAVSQIFYCKLDTMGDYVIAPMKIVYPPYTPGGGAPRIVVDRSSRLHVVWVDGRVNPGVTTDIFYKRGENEPGVEEEVQLNPVRQSSISVFPNPFSIETQIASSFSQASERSTIEIYDVNGRKVKEFIVDKPDAIITWQGTDDTGGCLPTGVYFLQYKTEHSNILQKIIKLK